MNRTQNHRFSAHLTISLIRFEPINSVSKSNFAAFFTAAFSLAAMMLNRAFALLLIAIISHLSVGPVNKAAVQGHLCATGLKHSTRRPAA